MIILPPSTLDVNHGGPRTASNMVIMSVIPSAMCLYAINNYMKMNQLCEVLNKQGSRSNVERMSKAIRSVLTEDTKQRSKGEDAYEEARQMDFERKSAEDMKSNRKMTFREMVNRYL